MPALRANKQKYAPIVAGEHVEKVGRGITRVPEKIASPPKARKEKIIAVRQKLDADKYSINERLNVAIDRLIEDFITKRKQENEEKSSIRQKAK